MVDYKRTGDDTIPKCILASLWISAQTKLAFNGKN